MSTLRTFATSVLGSCLALALVATLGAGCGKDKKKAAPQADPAAETGGGAGAEPPTPIEKARGVENVIEQRKTDNDQDMPE